MTTAKRRRRLERNITVYYILRILAKRLVWPILTIFLVRNKLSPVEIGTVYAAATIVGLVLEVPSGAIADRIGRRSAMALNFLGGAVSMFLFTIGDSFGVFLAAQILYHAAGSLMTGTHEAFLYETLHELGRTAELKRITGRALFLSQVSTGILFVAIPIIATYALHLPFALNIIVFLIAGALAWTLTEPKRATSVASAEVGRDFLGFRAFLTNRTLLTIGLAFAAVNGINGILEDFRQVYLDVVGIDLAFFGFVYLALRVLTGVVGTQVDRIERMLGRSTTLLLVPIISLAAYLALSFINAWYGVVFLVLDGVQDGLTRPLEQEALHAHVDGAQRATMLSIFNLLGGLFRAGAVFLGGIIIEVGGIHAGFILASTLVLLIAVPLFWRIAQHPIARPRGV